MKPRSILALALVFMVACAPGLGAVRQSVTNAEKVITAADQALDDADQKRYKEDLARFQAGDKDGAVKDFNSWIVIYKKLKAAIVDSHKTIKLIADSLPLAELGIQKSADTAAWMASIVKTMTNLVQLLNAFGLSVGGVK